MRARHILGWGLVFGLSIGPSAFAQQYPPAASAAPNGWGQPASFAPTTPAAYPATNVPLAYYAMQGSDPAPEPIGALDSSPPSAAPSDSAPSIGGSVFDADTSPWSTSPSCASACDEVTLKPWFAGGGALFFNREAECNLPLVVLDSDAGQVMLNTSHVDQEWSPGFEVYLGHYFNGGKNAVMVDYWGLFPSDAQDTAFDSSLGFRGANPSWNYAFLNDGNPSTLDPTVYDLFDNAQAFRARHGAQYQSAEINFLGFGVGGAARAPYGPGCGSCSGSASGCGPVQGCAGPGSPVILPCSSRLRSQWLAGVRWFQFSDWLEFGASRADAFFGSGSDDIYLNTDVTNDLVGFQLGGRLDYCLSQRWSIYAGTKAGVFNNHAQVQTELGNGDGPAYIDNSPYPSQDGQFLRHQASTDNLALLGELDLGLNYNFTNCWSLYGGWRLVGVNGVATSTAEIPSDIANMDQWCDNCTSQSLLLHGGYVGVGFNW